MKILKAVMLTLLISLCVTVAAVVVMQIFGGDSDGAQPRERVRGNADGDLSEGFDITILDTFDPEPGEDYRFWQRAEIKSEETGLWSYFPVLPWDVLPGETVVFGVSARGFKGWEVDPNFAHVELFDEKIEDEIAYVSFIMPVEEASVAALYDEIPSINYEMQKEQFMSRGDLHEHGAVPAPMSSSSNIEVGTQLDIYLVEGGHIDIQFLHPSLFSSLNTEGRIFKGDIVWLPIEAPIEAPGTEWIPRVGQPANPGAGMFGQLLGLLSAEGTYSFRFVIQQSRDNGITWQPWEDGPVYSYRLFVLPSEPPELVTEEIPDAMFGIPYLAYIDTEFLTTQTHIQNMAWQWNRSAIQSALPAGLVFRTDLSDTRGVIEGTVVEPLLSDKPYTINVVISITPQGHFTNLTGTFTIHVWDRPEISLPTWSEDTDTPGVWLDGMVGQPFNPLTGTGVSIIDTDENGVISVNAPVDPHYPHDPPDLAKLPGLDTVPPSWGWVQIGDLPDGLSFRWNQDRRIAALTGTPTAAAAAGDGMHVLTFGFQLLDSDLIYVPPLQSGTGTIPVATITFTVKIHPRIEFCTTTSIPDGMVGPEAVAEGLFPEIVAPGITWAVRDEPKEVYAGARIIATSIPDGTTGIDWSTPSLLPDAELKYVRPTLPDEDMRILRIAGETTDKAVVGDRILDIGFTIEHDNPNIDGATENRSYRLRIWNRAYLTVLIEPRTNFPIAAQVARLGCLDFQRYGRAVMPGQSARVYAPSPANFVRWEVSKLSDEDATPPELAKILAFTQEYPPAGPWTGIDRWGFEPQGDLSPLPFMEIRMPMPRNSSEPAINVQITGHPISHPAGVPNAVPTTNPQPLPTAIIGESYPAGLMIQGLTPANQAAIIGRGPMFATWSIVGGSLPPGMDINPFQGALFGVPEGPTGTYEFTAGFTLPGTMEMTFGPFFITVDRFVPTYGDVDGNGSLDLADLVLLARATISTSQAEINEAREFMRQRNTLQNGIIISGHPDFPQPADLFELQRWFALQGRYESQMASLQNQPNP